MALLISGLKLPKKGRYSTVTVYWDGRVVFKFGGAEAGQAIEIQEMQTKEDENMSEWIPITEQMPPEGKYVLVYGKGLYPNPNAAQIAVSEVYDGNYWSGFGRTWKITHWMPLPEPPKEDNPNE